MPPPPITVLPDRLKARRAEVGLTLAALAERTGIHLQTLSQIERGVRPNPTWATVVVLAESLGVTPDYFYQPGATAGTPPPEPPAPPKAMGKRK